jgi:pimeloyl-ACP methyl ester carboxylesterase/precorrin-6B methylase 2
VSRLRTWLGCAAAAAAVGARIYQRTGEARDARRHPAPGEFVTVDGRAVHVLWSGTSELPVLVVPAFGATAMEWVWVQRALPDSVPLTVVDRPGLGWSEPGRGPGTPVALAAWLSRVIDVLGFRRVVLVGHSYGGVVARVCAATDDRVVGLVLVDSAHEDQVTTLPGEGRAVSVRRAAAVAARPASWERLTEDLRGRRPAREVMTRLVPPEYVDGVVARTLTLGRKRAIVRELLGSGLGMRAVPPAARDLGDLPVTVLTAGSAGREAGYGGWLSLQKSFLGMSTRARHVELPHSGHQVNVDDPAAAAAAITDLVHGLTEHRVRFAALFDEEIRPHHERFRAALGIWPGDRVLDIGCGTGQSTRDAARCAGEGSALGVDVAPGALEVARRHSAEEGVGNVDYLLADAQEHDFPESAFDVCVSRFGVMFFPDPVAAFANIGRAIRPGGRLVLLVWQTADRNEWSTAVRAALGSPAGIDNSPFSLGDPDVVTGILTAAGLWDVTFTDVCEPVYYGPDADVAAEFVLGLREPEQLLARLDSAAADCARQRLRAVLAARDTGDGVRFGSRAWIVTARRAAG